MAKNFDVYKMTSNPSGFCVIINIVNFDGNTQLERVDSIKSVYLISETFNQLNFKLKIFHDLKDYEIKSKLNQLLNSEECESYDCFVLYIHSHGKEHGFITANNNVIEYHEIFDLFSNKNSQKLIGKPKLILFDCCRGDYYSPDLRDADKTMVNMSVHSDLFVVYSTLKSKLINNHFIFN